MRGNELRRLRILLPLPVLNHQPQGIGSGLERRQSQGYPGSVRCILASFRAHSSPRFRQCCRDSVTAFGEGFPVPIKSKAKASDLSGAQQVTWRIDPSDDRRREPQEGYLPQIKDDPRSVRVTCSRGTVAPG